jgi:diketogulonate reductase-like aldo/keto reductase
MFDCPFRLWGVIIHATKSRDRARESCKPNHYMQTQARADPLESNGALLNMCLERGVIFMSYSLLGTQWLQAPGQPNPVLTHPVITVGVVALLQLKRLALQSGRALIYMRFDLLPRTHTPSPINQPTMQRLFFQKIANELNKTPAQVVIRWSLQRGMTAIPRSSNPTHMEENLAVFDFEIDDDDMQQINKLDGTHEGPLGKVH